MGEIIQLSDEESEEIDKALGISQERICAKTADGNRKKSKGAWS